jgi:hypothetical protein
MNQSIRRNNQHGYQAKTALRWGETEEDKRETGPKAFA